jgi:hypothetical protein
MHLKLGESGVSHFHPNRPREHLTASPVALPCSVSAGGPLLAACVPSRPLLLTNLVLSDLLDRQTSGRQWSEQLGFRFGQVQPSKPIRAFEDHHLTIVDRRDVSPGWVVRIVNASPAPLGIGRHKPAKQNQSSPVLVNFHFDFGGLAPVNSKKCDAGIRQRPFGNRRPSERKLITGAPLGRAGGKPQRS